LAEFVFFFAKVKYKNSLWLIPFNVSSPSSHFAMLEGLLAVHADFFPISLLNSLA